MLFKSGGIPSSLSEFTHQHHLLVGLYSLDFVKVLLLAAMVTPLTHDFAKIILLAAVVIPILMNRKVIHYQ